MVSRNHFYSALLLTLVLSGAAFAQTEKKVAVGVLIDNTGSLRGQFDKVVELSKGVVERLVQRGTISLFHFTTQSGTPEGTAAITSGTEWSQNKSALDNYIDNLMVVPGRTALFDSIVSVVGTVSTKVNLEKDAYADKIIILITDGEDRVSKIKEKELIEKLKESGIKIYAIGLVQELESGGGLIKKSPRETAVNFLEKAAKETGGRAFFLKSKKVAVDSLLHELFIELGRK